jgi:hypothetical protein
MFQKIEYAIEIISNFDFNCQPIVSNKNMTQNAILLVGTVLHQHLRQDSS